jgi:hypothetical protein
MSQNLGIGFGYAEATASHGGDAVIWLGRSFRLS